MAAPTPVSAYLHSATMVKAGLFLLARIWPVLAGTDPWFLIVATTGLAIMLCIGAKIALLKDDLKALLAYSTVSHLGLITLLFGFDSSPARWLPCFTSSITPFSRRRCSWSAGIVDHETRTRDMRRLGGLCTLMPRTFDAGAVATCRWPACRC